MIVDIPIRSRRSAMAAAAVALLTVAAASAQDMHNPDQWTRAEKKIHEALGSNTRLEFIETPLADVVQFLSDLHQINIVVDRRALQQAGIDTSLDAPVTVNLRDVTLRSALHLTLRSVDLGDRELTFELRNEVLSITVRKDRDGVRVAPNRESKTTKEIYTELDNITQLEFIETPLADVLDYVSDLHDIPVFVDNKGLEAVGAGGDIPISRNIRGVTLRSALRTTLHGKGLTYQVRDETLFITSREQAARYRPSRPPKPSVFLGTESEKKIYKALDEATSLDFLETPLRDIMDFLGDRHDAQIVADEAVWRHPAFTSSGSAITIRLDDVKLRSALNLVLEPLDLVFVVRHEVLWITSTDARFEPGDPVTVAAETVRMVRNGRPIARLDRGTRFRVAKTRDQWVAGMVTIDNVRYAGWVPNETLELAPPPSPAP